MADELYARIGAAIRARRDRAGLTQAALAELTGLKRTTVTNIESGGQAITLVQLREVAKALATDAGRLFEEADRIDLAAPTSSANNPLASELLRAMRQPARSAAL